MNSAEKIILSVISEEKLNLLIKEYRIHDFRKGYTFGPHQHSWVEINYIKKGSCVMSFNDESICFKENECMIIYPEVKHSFNVNNIKGCTLIQLEFNMIIFPELVSSVFDIEKSLSFLYNYITNSSRFVKIVNNKSISSAMERIISELNENNGEESLLTRVCFSELVILLSRQIRDQLTAVKDINNKFVRKAVELINLNYTNQSYSLEDLAKDCAISSRYLRDIFLKQTGVRLIDFLIGLRIKYAQKLLKDREMNIAEVAYDSGFNSPQYFSSCFKKISGYTPKKFKENYFRKV